MFSKNMMNKKTDTAAVSAKWPIGNQNVLRPSNANNPRKRPASAISLHSGASTKPKQKKIKAAMENISSGRRLPMNEQCQLTLPKVVYTNECGIIKNYYTTAVPPTPAQPLLLNQFNVPPPSVSGAVHSDINTLFQSLASTGVFDSLKSIQMPKEEKPILGDRHSLRKQYPTVLSAIYSGTQCSNCGKRFPVNHANEYNEHLDWHFRQNRRENKAKGEINNRQFYYKVSDWEQYSENTTGNVDDSQKCFFEIERMRDAECKNSLPPQQTCAVDPNKQENSCDVCQDEFEVFFDQDAEEWCFRNAIRADGCVLHQTCYEDFLRQSSKPIDSEYNADVDEFENIGRFEAQLVDLSE